MHKGIDELYNNEQLKAIDNLMKTVPTTYLSEISKSVSNIVIPDYSVTKSSDMISETTKALTDLAVMSSKSSAVSNVSFHPSKNFSLLTFSNLAIRFISVNNLQFIFTFCNCSEPSKISKKR